MYGRRKRSYVVAGFTIRVADALRPIPVLAVIMVVVRKQTYASRVTLHLRARSVTRLQCRTTNE